MDNERQGRRGGWLWPLIIILLLLLLGLWLLAMLVDQNKEVSTTQDLTSTQQEARVQASVTETQTAKQQNNVYATSAPVVQ